MFPGNRMADSEGHPMKPEDREKLLSEVKQKGVLDETERKNLIEKLDSDFDLFLKEKIGSNRKDEHHVPATDEDIDKLAEVNTTLSQFQIVAFP